MPLIFFDAAAAFPSPLFSLDIAFRFTADIIFCYARHADAIIDAMAAACHIVCLRRRFIIEFFAADATLPPFFSLRYFLMLTIHAHVPAAPRCADMRGAA